MSNHLISETYKRQLGSMARKAVMVLLADKASDDGTGIWASKQRMADEIGTSKQTVITTIKSLVGDKLVREAGQRKSPNGYTVEYAINVAALRRLPLVKSHADDQSSTLTGQTALPVKEDDPTGQAALPDQSSTLTQTSLNPPKPELEAKASCASDDALKPEHVVESWNKLAAKLGKPVVRDLTPERRVKVKARIAGYSLADWREVISNIDSSPFLRGDKDWQGCTFDWMTKKANFQKILEGNYNG